MLGILKGSKEQKLRKKYRKLLKEAYALSHSNRRLSDAKYAEAQQIIDEIDGIKEKSLSE